MEMEVIKDVKNDLLCRRELDLIIKDFNATPSKSELVSFLVSKLGVNKKNFILDRINQKSGKREILCFARVYESLDYMKKYEPKFKLERSKSKEMKKVEETPKKEEISKEGEVPSKEEEKK